MWQAHLEEGSQSQRGRQPVGLRGEVCLSCGHNSISQPCGGNIHLHTKAHMRLQPARTASLKGSRVANASSRVQLAVSPCKESSLSSLTQLSVITQLIRLVTTVRSQAKAMHGLSSKLPHGIWAHAQQSFCDPQHNVHNAKCACALTASPTR